APRPARGVGRRPRGGARRSRRLRAPARLERNGGDPALGPLGVPAVAARRERLVRRARARAERRDRLPHSRRQLRARASLRAACSPPRGSVAQRDRSPLVRSDRARRRSPGSVCSAGSGSVRAGDPALTGPWAADALGAEHLAQNLGRELDDLYLLRRPGVLCTTLVTEW